MIVGNGNPISQSPVGAALFHKNSPERIDHSSEFRDPKQVLSPDAKIVTNIIFFNDLHHCAFAFHLCILQIFVKQMLPLLRALYHRRVFCDRKSVQKRGVMTRIIFKSDGHHLQSTDCF